MMNNPMLTALQQLKANPMQILQQRFKNLPQNLSNNPQEIVQQLLNSGNVKQEQVDHAVGMVMGNNRRY